MNREYLLLTDTGKGKTMSDDLCPLCGKKKDEKAEFCSDCIDIAQYQYIEDLPAQTNQEIEGKEPHKKANSSNETKVYQVEKRTHPPHKKTSKTPIVFITALFLFLAVGIGSAYYYNYLKRTDGDLQCWTDATNDGSSLAYSKYLLKYPEGRFSVEAKEKLSTSHQSEEVVKEQAQPAQTEKETAAAPAPQPPIAKEQSAATTAKSDIVSADELNKLKAKLKTLAYLFSLQRYTELKTKHISPTLSNYLGKKDKAFNAIINELIADRNNKRIKEITYTLKPASVKADRKGEKGYSVSGDYEYMIVYKDKKKNRVVKTASFRLDINNQGLVEAIM